MPGYSDAGSGDSGHPQEDSADEGGVDSTRLRGKWRVEAKKSMKRSWETFLSYEDPEKDILIGLLRLRKAG